MNEVVKMSAAEIEAASDEMADAVQKRVREMAVDPINATVPRDELVVRAVKAEFARRPKLAQAWRDAPGYIGGRP